uniref:Uncharacterized protein n=1 Tax=Glossina austeni TaxID=7395 RepID=A0A1A9UJU5_GLOAU
MLPHQQKGNYLRTSTAHCVCLVPLHQHFYRIFVGNASAGCANRLAYDNSTRFRQFVQDLVINTFYASIVFKGRDINEVNVPEILCHKKYTINLLNRVGTEPVKLMPANSLELVMAFANVGPSAGTKLTTPSGTPASLIILNISQLDSIAVSAGFHKTALPIRAELAPLRLSISFKTSKKDGPHLVRIYH